MSELSLAVSFKNDEEKAMKYFRYLYFQIIINFFEEALRRCGSLLEKYKNVRTICQIQKLSGPVTRHNPSSLVTTNLEERKIGNFWK